MTFQVPIQLRFGGGKSFSENFDPQNKRGMSEMMHGAPISIFVTANTEFLVIQLCT